MSAGRSNKSHSRDWGTPRKYVDVVKKFFGGVIELDPCSNQHSIVGALVEYSLPDDDGLRRGPWDFPSVFVNPPYGADRQRGTTIRHWIEMCARSHAMHGAEVLALVPVATNTRHWKQFVFGSATAVAFLYDTRLRFLVNGQEGGKGAPMACAMVYWGVRYHRFAALFADFGAVVDIRPLQGVRNRTDTRKDRILDLDERARLFEEWWARYSVGLEGADTRSARAGWMWGWGYGAARAVSGDLDAGNQDRVNVTDLAGWRFQYDHRGNLVEAHHRCRYGEDWVRAITSHNSIASCPLCGRNVSIETNLDDREK